MAKRKPHTPAKRFVADETFEDVRGGKRYRCVAGVEYAVKAANKELWQIVDEWKAEGKVKIINAPRKGKADESG